MKKVANFIVVMTFFVGIFVATEVCARGLCVDQEKVVFDCNTKGKNASLCVADGSNEFHYRFGTKDKVEIVFPEKDDVVEKVFFLSSRLYAGGGEGHVRFENNGYTYYLYDKSIKDDGGLTSTSGVYIFKGRRNIVKLQCDNDASIHSQAYNLFRNENYKDIGSM